MILRSGCIFRYINSNKTVLMEFNNPLPSAQFVTEYHLPPTLPHIKNERSRKGLLCRNLKVVEFLYTNFRNSIHNVPVA